jgi:uncharacterized membrane protein
MKHSALHASLAATLLTLWGAAASQEGARTEATATLDRHRELSHQPVRASRRFDPKRDQVESPRGELWRDLSADQRRSAIEGLAPAEAAPRGTEATGRRMTPDERRALRQQIRDAHREQRPLSPGQTR